MDHPGRHSRRGALASTKQVRTLQADTTDEVHYRARKQIWAPPRQTRCISEHSTKLGSFRQTNRRGALASTKTDLDPPGRHSRRRALASTKQVGTLQADTDQHGALAFTETDLGPSI